MKNKNKIMIIIAIALISNFISPNTFGQKIISIYDTISSGDYIIADMEETYVIDIKGNGPIYVKAGIPGSHYQWADGTISDSVAFEYFIGSFLTNVKIDNKKLIGFSFTFHPCSNVYNIDTTICQGTAFLWKGEHLDLEPGSYSFKDSCYILDPFSANIGCDSITLLKVTVLANQTTTIDTIVCTMPIQIEDKTYNQPGTYYDTLTSISGCDSIVILNISTGPSSNFTWSVDYLTANFIAEDTSNDMFWNFGDGSFSNQKTPIHTYANRGYKKVCLTADNGICQNKTCIDINITALETSCLADFQINTLKSETTFDFIDKSKGNPNKWHWDFGDGTSSTEQHPSKKYSKPAKYKVKLTIHNTSTNCIEVCEKEVEIQGSTECTPSFTYSLNTKKKEVNLFTPNTANSYIWDFGDGTSSTQQNPSKKYSKDGIYSICLSVITDNCRASYCQDITIGNVCKGYFTYIADGNTVSFQDKSIGNINNWKWNFGDGGHSDQQNPIYTYTKSKEFYHVHLNVKGDGCVSHYNDVIAINTTGIIGMFAYADSNLTINKKSLESEYIYQFFSAFWGGPTRFVWDFGDGTYDSLAMNPTKTFSDTGTYNVCLTVYRDALDQEQKYCRTIRIKSTETKINYLKSDWEKLTFYPNPAQDFIYLSSSSISKIDIMDVLGNKIISIDNPKQSIDIRKLNKGIFIVLLQDDKKNQKSFKLIKR